ncbi:uncharacterized protein LOC127858821 isoform X2 [Dreissena polymorpha]|uniref:uncharacterized protein LOC127858821 isoform X2 n=1 Tax=Dreissena polymorpha TaxID=45954 RepID=UPI002264749A|nr:uncharacterized protein LOC127858821 isoform X2 [Dreissena polymorpha]
MDSIYQIKKIQTVTQMMIQHTSLTQTLMIQNLKAVELNTQLERVLLNLVQHFQQQMLEKQLPYLMRIQMVIWKFLRLKTKFLTPIQLCIHKRIKVFICSQKNYHGMAVKRDMTKLTSVFTARRRLNPKYLDIS